MGPVDCQSQRTSASDQTGLYSAPHEPQVFEYWPHWPPWVCPALLAAQIDFVRRPPIPEFRRQILAPPLTASGCPAWPQPSSSPSAPSRFTDVLGRLDFASLRAHDPEESTNASVPRSPARSCRWSDLLDRLSERQMIVLVILFGLLLYLPSAGPMDCGSPGKPTTERSRHQMVTRGDFISLWCPGSTH